MKRKIFIVGLVFIILLSSCSGSGSPKTAVQKFYKAVEKNDSKAMAEVATTETVQLIAMFGTKAQGMLAANGKIKTLTEDIDGDTATVNVVFENGEETELDLIKVNGKWKVTIDMGK
jgi:hypothetical protein